MILSCGKLLIRRLGNMSEISHKGAGDHQGKFNVRPVAAGHRFTFEIMLEGNKDDTEIWKKLLSIFVFRNSTFLAVRREAVFGACKVEIPQGGYL